MPKKQPHTTPEIMLDIPEVARITCLSESFIQKLATSRLSPKIPCFRMGNRLRFLRSEIVAWAYRMAQLGEVDTGLGLVEITRDLLQQRQRLCIVERNEHTALSSKCSDVPEPPEYQKLNNNQKTIAKFLQSAGADEDVYAWRLQPEQ